MEFNHTRKAALLRAYRDGRIEIDSLVSAANRIGLSRDELVCLLEEAAHHESPSSRNGELGHLLTRGYCGGALSLEDVVGYAYNLGFEDHELIHLTDQLEMVNDSGAASDRPQQRTLPRPPAPRQRSRLFKSSTT